MKYICESCGKEHEEWPALTFDSPNNYHNLSEEEKTSIAEINSDFCVITYSDQTDRFIRVTLTQKVIDHCEDLEYGLWVSLSEKSFNDYSDKYNNEDHEAVYFGFLSNDIPGYNSTIGVHTNVCTRTGNNRPYIVPHQNFDHPFTRDYFNGIPKEVAGKRIKAMMGG